LVRHASAFGAAAQASVPGVCAWGITVAPAAWARGASSASKVAAVAALLALAAGIVGERASGGAVGDRSRAGLARTLSLWGFVLASALAWSTAPASLGPLRVDAPRGVAGMVAWALFAFASAAPALQGWRGASSVKVEEGPLAPRRGLARGDAAYVGAGGLVAAALQVVGWRAANAERAVLIRFVALAAGLAVIGATVEIALLRHVPRRPRSSERRLRGATATFVLLALLGVVGVLFAVRG
jgi:hypothetical protein